jgi:polysaccharide pyruvyl transferase WcaK-like protein
VLTEVRRTGFANKGAQLMLLAAQQRLRARFANSQIVLAPSRPSGSQPIAQIWKGDFLAKSSFRRLGLDWGELAAVVPGNLRKRIRLVLKKEVDLVLDAAGFAYGSPWSNDALFQLKLQAQHCRRHRIPLILLPQAFGRFDDPTGRRHLSYIADVADLIFARDTTSLKNLHDALGHRSNIDIAPDFTCLVPGRTLARVDNFGDNVAIVPNIRMLDKTLQATRATYISFLSSCIKHATKRGLRTLILVHSPADDGALAMKLHQDHPHCEVLQLDDPLEIKGVIGSCRGLIGSRYHALVNALSQGIPAFGTSWSHKYQSLYDDYYFSEGLLTGLCGETAERAIDLLTSDRWLNSARARLSEASKKQAQLAESMWLKVFGLPSLARFS